MKYLSSKEQILFIKRMEFLMKAGVPLLDSLQLVRRQIKNKSARNMLDQVIADVSNGRYLSAALQKFRATFGEFTISLLAIGERGES